ncbi:MAG TPA: hypothetical protein VGB52_00965 [Actinomycetota bacterium]
MRGDAASVRPEASPLARSFEPVETFVAVLLGRIDDPSHPSVAGLAGRARTAARAATRAGRAPEGVQTALRLAYEQARADAAAIKPVATVPAEGPRWWRVLAALAALRHRQRAALTLYYVLGQSIEHTAVVLGVRPPEARKVVEAGVAQLVRAMGEPVDVRRALRTAGSRLVSEADERIEQRTMPARMPRAVVRTLLAPVEAGEASAPPAPESASMPAPPIVAPALVITAPLVSAVLEQLEDEPPDLIPPVVVTTEIIPAPRPRRRDPFSRRLAWAAAVIVVLLAALLPAGAGDHLPAGAGDNAPVTGDGPIALGSEPSIEQQVDPAVPALPPIVVISRGDSLWLLAKSHLGDPLRWTEIWRLNRNKRMGDGVRFRSPDLIMPGWRLRLPDA